MPRTCTICSHPERGDIDQALLAGEAFRNIAARFGTSTAALVRHRKDHVPAHLAKAKDAEAVSEADSLLDRLVALSKETAAILKEARAEETKDNELALKAIARCEKQLELQVRLLNGLKDERTVNILVMSEWHQMRTALFTALLPYPQARVAVAAALHRAEHANGHGT